MFVRRLFPWNSSERLITEILGDFMLTLWFLNLGKYVWTLGCTSELISKWPGGSLTTSTLVTAWPSLYSPRFRKKMYFMQGNLRVNCTLLSDM